MRFPLVLASCVALSGTSLLADLAADDTQARLVQLEAAFGQWLEDQGAQGSLAVRRGAQALPRIDLGLDGADALDLASVGKAITAVCAAELVEAGTLDWSETASVDVALSALLVHASGLTQDSTQALMVAQFGADGPHLSARVRAAIEDRGGPQARAGKFRYNNENYALAALVIEEGTAQSYDSACRDAVLDPLDITARVSEISAISLPWGGWAMPLDNFALWHAHWFGPDTDAGSDPLSLPHIEIDTGLYYGLGTFFRTLDRGNVFWHFGALCFPGRAEAGSYAATFFGDWTVVAAYDACVDQTAMFALDTAVVGALFGPLP